MKLVLSLQTGYSGSTPDLIQRIELGETELWIQDSEDSMESSGPESPSSGCLRTMNLSGKHQRSSYNAAFKLQVIQRAEETNNSVASREFNINEKQVREWRKIKAELRDMPKSKKARRHGVASFTTLEDDLHSWVTECRQNGNIVTRTNIRLRALQMAKSGKYQSEGIQTFLASIGWCSRFMNRYGLCLRQRTKISQKLPKDLECKVSLFQKFIIKQCKKHNYELGDIGNMDEMPMTFDLPCNQTVASIGEKTVFVRSTGNEKNHFTVVLSCLANGTKLRPVIIFKRKTLPKNVKLPSGVIVRVHEKGWMDEEGMQKWLHDVWNARPGAALKKKPSLLVWDMFRAHVTGNIKDEANSLKTTLAVIPSGLTSMLQPLDMCLNKTFKDRVRKMRQDWMLSGEARLTKGGNLMKPDIELIAKWVRDAWEDIPTDVVRRAFLKCGISNAMDGTEDGMLYEGDDNDGEDGEQSDDDAYTNDVTDADFELLFGKSDDENDDFEGF
uniref:HTH CENPB-type domain-containing protein n=1 Tax=Pelusios castaneus TaxID=367368 RepID=A0A8C8VPE3_9SAUR